MFESAEVPGFGNERRGGQEADATHRLECRYHRSHCPARNNLHQWSFLSTDPFDGRSHCIQHFLERKPLGGMGKVLPFQPAQMRPCQVVPPS
jgi:hypothetical protein